MNSGIITQTDILYEAKRQLTYKEKWWDECLH